MNITMKRDAVIKIKDGGGDASAILTQGVVRKEGDAYYIEYETQSESKTEKFIIGLSDDTVTVSKIAEESYTMVMQENKLHSFDVQTPFGILSLIMLPTKVKASHSDNGLKVKLDYTIRTSVGGAEEKQEFSLQIECRYAI